MEILRIKKLTKVYNAFKEAKEVIALNEVSFNVDKAEFIGIMGPSGSGKTTLLNILSGIDKATSGEVHINGQDIIKMKKDELALFRRRKVGFIFQDFNLLDSLSVKENIAFPLIIDKVNPQEIEQRAKDIMKYLGIEELQNKYPYNISGGEKQRAAAARALICEPSVIFADEPTGNLDSKSSKSIMTTFKNMNEEKSATVIMVTHDAFAASFCKRIIFIKDGAIRLEIVSDGDRNKFFDKILEAQSVIGGEK
ncbi:ABC transporter ATP-binding protein [Clostridium tagluense]|uniref:ABC transporter ATP-binding protein n=1 Tax=Clostridium tagluense TaxID=360422 RepID=UPI001CF2F989|nr:ABC transporter ATP-binding protein [Clostridium tagluense]MCB2310224.1 ABC transporter ATP-binding protein [Clostridium tagluense]MCB2315134.1 ABC transporter ATP-binding protein [Clostridium tagluense]MCB2319924.1 ABC transporter ATP-binding protein [Clostridium tagluense]MCB2324877.1 ABC transporter ATP-binding protein [Clostridium tagluense]MCB2329669.1 ABC transporter ATP-binding protein [Clostridium tagluense]